MSEHFHRLFAGLLTYLFVVNSMAVVVEFAGLDQKTIHVGRQELNSWSSSFEQVDRIASDVRPIKKREHHQFSQELDSLHDDTLAGDPMSGKKLVRKNLR